MTKYSFLDLVPVTDTGTIALSLHNAADEVILASSIYDHEVRKHSVALAMEAARAV